MKTTRNCKLSALLALLLLLFLIFPGCAQNSPAGTTSYVRKVQFDYSEPITLRLAIGGKETGMDCGVESQIRSVIEEFKKVYPDVTIELEFVTGTGVDLADPDYLNKREEKINAIQNEMAEGFGPDLFIFNNITSDVFFPDLNWTMREGVFADLNEYYQNDADLDRAKLVSSVMDAGVVGDARYVIPLRYNLPILFAIPDRLLSKGLSTEIFDDGITELLNRVTRLGDPDVAKGLSQFKSIEYLLSYFPDLIDYDTREVIISQDELAAFLQACRDYKAEFPKTGFCYWSSTPSFCKGRSWQVEDSCMVLLNGTCATFEAASAQALGLDLEMHIQTGSSGETVAAICYYGAVNANCPYPDVAYEFLRCFLAEETQWEQNVDLSKVTLTGNDKSEFESRGDSMSGLPVLREGAVPALYEVYRERSMNAIAVELALKESIDIDYDAFTERKIALEEVELEDFDVPVYWEDPYIARFDAWELTNELLNLIAQLNDPETGDPTGLDVDQLAGDYIDFLHTYLRVGTKAA